MAPGHLLPVSQFPEHIPNPNPNLPQRGGREMAPPKPKPSIVTPLQDSTTPPAPDVPVDCPAPAVPVDSPGPAVSVDSPAPDVFVESPASAVSLESPASAASTGSPSSACYEGSPDSSVSLGLLASATAGDPLSADSEVGSAVSPKDVAIDDVGGSAVSPKDIAIDDYSGMKLAERLILDLHDADLRENALLELTRKREVIHNLGLMLWHSFGTMAILLQEVTCVYPFLSPPTLTLAQSNRACNALALLQCVASHPATRRLFVQAHIPLYLYSFLTTDCKSMPFEYLRLTCLGVLGAIVKMDDSAIICFLLATEIIPLCLRTMEIGSELSKTVGAYILLKILQDGVGLEYVCVVPDRFYAVGRVLRNLVAGLAEQVQPSARLLKHIIRCYVRLSEDPRGRMGLRNSLPRFLVDGRFNSLINEDPMMKRNLQQLLLNVHGSLAGLGGTVIDILARVLSILV